MSLDATVPTSGRTFTTFNLREEGLRKDIYHINLRRREGLRKDIYHI